MSVRPPRAVLLVCTGNICRSPLAEGILRAKLKAAALNIEVDSAGTHDYHVGEPADPRARRVAREFGLDIDDLRARRIERADFERFERILVADRANLLALSARLGDLAERAELLREHAGEGPGLEVPDPYYGDYRGFQDCFALLDRVCSDLLRRWANPA